MHAVTVVVGFRQPAVLVGEHRVGVDILHAAGIGDTLGLLCVVSAMAVASGLNMDTLKLLFLIFFMWFTSPVSTHFLSQVEYYTNKDRSRYMTFRKGGKPHES